MCGLSLTRDLVRVQRFHSSWPDPLADPAFIPITNRTTVSDLAKDLKPVVTDVNAREWPGRL